MGQARWDGILRFVQLFRKLLMNAREIKGRGVLGIWPNILDSHCEQSCDSSGEQTSLRSHGFTRRMGGSMKTHEDKHPISVPFPTVYCTILRSTSLARRRYIENRASEPSGNLDSPSRLRPGSCSGWSSTEGSEDGAVVDERQVIPITDSESRMFSFLVSHWRRERNTTNPRIHHKIIYTAGTLIRYDQALDQIILQTKSTFGIDHSGLKYNIDCH